MEEGFQVRNVLNPTVVQELADALHQTWSDFNKNSFVQNITQQLDQHSFAGRVTLIANQLTTHLPKDFPAAIDILLSSLGPELPGTEELSGWDGFILMPQTRFIRDNGMGHYDISMNALYEMTKRFSAELDIRAFIQNFPEPTLERLHTWTQDPNCHVRRLVSEGTRPRLPWASRLPEFQKDPSPVIELLEKLNEDPILYVRRSVANNLNDIAKDHPDLVVDTLRRWDTIENPGTQWIIRHASRTLVKAGHLGALELLGYPADLQVKVTALNVQPESLAIGESLKLEVSLVSESNQPQNLMIDYAIHFMKANGKQAPKVFKFAKKTLEPGDTLNLSKAHSFKPISTRKYYAGEHIVELKINGASFGKYYFQLL